MNYQKSYISRRNVVFILMGTLIILLIFLKTVSNSFTSKSVTFKQAENICNDDVQYKIESQEYDPKSNIITIKGWAFLEGETINTYKCNVILRDNETKSYIKLPTQLVIREDVAAAFKDSDSKLKYDKSGFKARLKLNELKKPMQNYEIYLDYNNNDANRLVKTGVFLNEKGSN